MKFVVVTLIDILVLPLRIIVWPLSDLLGVIDKWQQGWLRS